MLADRVEKKIAANSLQTMLKPLYALLPSALVNILEAPQIPS